MLFRYLNSIFLRRTGDSNPRYGETRTTVFETAGLDHSPSSPNMQSYAIRTDFEIKIEAGSGRSGYRGDIC